MSDESVVDRGTVSFSVESRLLRELGERLVREPEVALLELIKNAYDADATVCRIEVSKDQIVVTDDGHGMTLAEFKSGWMRVGSSSKVASNRTRVFGRPTTGEKGIGRFAVRFLGRSLELTSVARVSDSPGFHQLRASFDWPAFDRAEDLGTLKVPYVVRELAGSPTAGTTLRIGQITIDVKRLDARRIRTGSIGILSPLRPLLRGSPRQKQAASSSNGPDPGFSLALSAPSDQEEVADLGGDVAEQVLESYVLRAQLELHKGRLTLSVKGSEGVQQFHDLSIDYATTLQHVRADIRFFPRRKGVFRGGTVAGNKAYRWVRDNAGVAVFDRGFRVSPYGMQNDDWLNLDADAATNAREPRSTIAKTYFPMSPEEKKDTAENWMLRLPQSAQLLGVVEVASRRQTEGFEDGLVPAADREGFVDNEAFRDLRDLIRGAVEAIAEADRRLQRQIEEQERIQDLADIEQQAAEAVAEVRGNPSLAPADKRRLEAAISRVARDARRRDEAAQEQRQRLETMSLLGVVAGYMSHEFGTALAELRTAIDLLANLEEADGKVEQIQQVLEDKVRVLEDFVSYSTGYVQGAADAPDRPYPARPRVRQVVRTFGEYAQERRITVDVQIPPEVMAPLVPVSLYSGVALNLYSNALKAITARRDENERRIAFRAWNEPDAHYLQVSDTGTGIPRTLRERVFDPLFTTTASNADPLGSGLGLGLALVRRAVEAFGGRAAVVDPPPGFTTCIEVRLPVQGGSDE